MRKLKHRQATDLHRVIGVGEETNLSSSRLIKGASGQNLLWGRHLGTLKAALNSRRVSLG